jgi:hypothetical protein
MNINALASYPELSTILDELWEKHSWKIHRIQSIYEHAPVFQLELTRPGFPKQLLVLKRTRSPLGLAVAVQEWLNRLRQKNVSTVLAEKLEFSNPFPVGDDVWIFYPFISGEEYRNEPEFIDSAANLLGQMHKQGIQEETPLPGFDFPEETMKESFEEDLKKIAENMKSEDMVGDDYLRILNQKCEGFERLCAQLKDNYSKFPLCVASWDYKAVNLVYRNSGSPVFVDPDSAGVLPRLFDFCLAILLFHNDSGDHVLNIEEFEIFKEAYQRHVQFNELEKEFFPMVLEFMYLDEIVWLLGNDPEGWKESGAQSRYLKDALCLCARLGQFQL